jgi:hypothetical protein
MLLAAPVVPAGGVWGAEGSAVQVSFVASATAAGSRAQYDLPNFAVVTSIVDGGGSFAQAQVDAVGGYGFASMPYPGQTVINGPGILAGVAGINLPGGYPFYVVASHPTTPDAHMSDSSQAYGLSAKAAQDSASGTARFNMPPGASGGGTSLADTSIRTLENGTVEARAESLVEALSFNQGLLKIGSIRTTSSTSFVPGKEPKTTQSVEIVGAKVGDTPVTIGPKGVQLGSAAVPASASQSAAGLNAALAERGLAVRLVDGTDIAGGRQGMVVEVKSTHPVPAPGNPKGTLTLQFGAVSTAVLVGSESYEEFTSTAPEVNPGTSTAFTPPPPERAEPSPDPQLLEPGVPPRVRAAAPRAGSRSRGGAAPSPVTSGLEPVAESAGVEETQLDVVPPGGANLQASTRVQPATTNRLALEDGMRRLYVVIGVGGLAVAIGGFLWRRRGTGLQGT